MVSTWREVRSLCNNDDVAAAVAEAGLTHAQFVMIANYILRHHKSATVLPPEATPTEVCSALRIAVPTAMSSFTFFRNAIESMVMAAGVPFVWLMYELTRIVPPLMKTCSDIQSCAISALNAVCTRDFERSIYRDRKSPEFVQVLCVLVIMYFVSSVGRMAAPLPFNARIARAGAPLRHSEAAFQDAFGATWCAAAAMHPVEFFGMYMKHMFDAVPPSRRVRSALYISVVMTSIKHSTVPQIENRDVWRDYVLQYELMSAHLLLHRQQCTAVTVAARRTNSARAAAAAASTTDAAAAADTASTTDASAAAAAAAASTTSVAAKENSSVENENGADDPPSACEIVRSDDREFVLLTDEAVFFAVFHCTAREMPMQMFNLSSLEQRYNEYMEGHPSNFMRFFNAVTTRVEQQRRSNEYGCEMWERQRVWRALTPPQFEEMSRGCFDHVQCGSEDEFYSQQLPQLQQHGSVYIMIDGAWRLFP